MLGIWRPHDIMYFVITSSMGWDRRKCPTDKPVFLQIVLGMPMISFYICASRDQRGSELV